MSPSRNQQQPGAVAVIGISGRFPGAPDIASFWRNLRDGVEAARELSQNELESAGVEPELLRDPRYVRTGVVLEDVELFDASFFGLTPRDAELMDPQHRLFLECAWEAMEDAGYDSRRTPGEVGVFTSALMSHYLLLHLLPRRELVRRAGSLALRIFNDKDFLPTRVSYELNLQGPSLAVQTACSSSLVGCHLACQSLINFECDMALVGGVGLNLPQAGYLYQEGSINSPDGHCRPFDTRAQGTISGSGVGIVVLRRLEDAIAAGDRIRAVIRGTAVNNDGSIKVGYTAPSVEGQAAVVAAALEFAGVDADTLGLIEAHGTGTPMGDPIEVAALTQVFRETTSRRGFCSLGSVKASIGHLDTAAGVAGLIKAVLALEHKVIPPSINCDQPSPDLDLPSTPFYIATEAKPWVANGAPRRAGVTSLGVGGTNAHVVLEEAPPGRASGASRPWQLLVWSARDAQGLEDATRRLADHLESGPADPLADLAFTLQMGRAAFGRRRALVCRGPEDALESLRGGPRRWIEGGDASGEPQVAFLFPGQGSQHTGMGRDLYQSERVYREVIDDCAERLRPHLGLDLRPLLHAADDEEAAARQLQQTRIAQPALFVVEYALARLWMDWGVTPQALLGHSIGEYVAACLAGVMSLADALELVAARGRLMQSLPPGAMLSVALSAGELESLLDPRLSLAAINAEAVTTVAGPAEAIDALAARLVEHKVEHRRLRTSHAFHSAMVEPVVAAFVEQAARMKLRPPQIRLLSNVSGTWMTPQEATDPGYWGQQLRRTVRFSAALRELLSVSEGALLEVGPGQALTRLARLHRQDGNVPWAVASMRHPQQAGEDLEHLLGALGRLWAGGVHVDWERFSRFERRRRVAAPTYPFQRRRYWIEPVATWGDDTEIQRRELEHEESAFADSFPESAEAGLADALPALPLERSVAWIWREVLGVQRIAAGDDFFELGGNSLTASQVVSRLWETLGIQVSVQDLFEEPTVAGLAARLSSAGAEPAAADLPPSGSQPGTVPPPLLPVAREGSLPLSFAQQRLWFIDQLEPGSSLYNMPVALRVEGPLHAGVLAASLGEIVRRHEALRTVFALRGGAPGQVIRQPAPFRLPAVDLSGLPESRRETQALALAEEEAGRPFDLAHDPLLRGVLLRLDEHDHVAALTLHHIASDGWSMGILVREVMALYAAFAEGQPSPLPELPVQYADFAAWQSSWLQGEVLESEIAYWRRELAGLPPLLELPTDRPRPAVQSFRGASRPVRLPDELARKVEALGRREGATLFMVLLAGLQTLLARASGQEDLAVGSPVAGRRRTEVEGLIGFFVNTLVLRGNLAGAPTFREILGRVRGTALAAYMHQDLPFEKLVEELAPERSLAHTPLFQVMFVLQNAPAEDLEIRDLRLRPFSGAGTTAKFDLTINLGEHDGELIGIAEHATDLYDSTTIDRLIGHFERLLAAAVASPDEPAFALPLLSPEEHRQILVEWNDTAAESAYRTPACLDALFAAQVRRTPDTIAVVFGDEELTYAELDSRASRLARHLRRLGVGPDVLVGLSVERSLEMIVGVLGILRAGGVCVPLDPQYPAQRLAFMLEDTSCPVLLTQASLRDRLPAGSYEVLLLDSEDGISAADGAMPPAVEPAAENLVYVIYTSGSTGRPKGVALSQGVLRNLIDWHLAVLLGGARTLQFASLSFDASFHEMFACWGSGGTLVVVPEELRRDMPALAALLVDQRIEKAILPVVVLQQLAEIFAGQEQLPPLREITTTGERLQTNRAMATLLRRLPGCAFHNHYGPSETHVATASTLRPDPEDWTLYPPIGRPIWNSSTYVLAPGLVPAPIGMPGDLYIGGACLARGYLRRPDLTAQKFVPDPFAGEPGARLYRTGDKVRLLPQGELEFLGRFDDQVKIRGFRIELGEIEALLLALPGVREAAVVVREDRPGDRRLVAYVAGDVTVDALRQSLHERLPDYMVPTSFVTLAALPLTPNGKVDRKALPAPDAQGAGEDHVAPRTPVEEVLACIWSEVLGRKRIGASDHFFDLGGHSLLATQVMSRLRGAFGVEMPLRDLFAAPRLADLAGRVEAALRAGARSLTPPLLPVPRQGPLPLSFAQQRLWFIDQLEPGSSLYNIAAALRIEGPLDRAALALCLGEIVRRHEVLRTVFAAREGTPEQVIQPPAPFVLPLVDLSGLPGNRREPHAFSLAGDEAGLPFDLTQGPLLRGVLLRLTGEDHLFTLTVHHIASDGWSTGILVREVMELYPAFAAGRPSPLPELPVQYADFAVWQSSWLQGEILGQEIAFWRRELAGLPPLLELPTDRPRPPVQSFQGGLRPVRLSAELIRQAEALARREGATLFMVLLAGFQTLLARISGQDDLAVGSPTAGRNRTEIEGLIGFFLNTLVLRGNLAGAPTFRELLGRVRETALAAYLHQDVPFEKLVEELAPERSLAYTPLFQVMLTLQNLPLGSVEMGGLVLSEVTLDPGLAKLDLSLLLEENDGELAGSLRYAADLFDQTTIFRWVDHLEQLLAEATAQPHRSIADLEILSAAQRIQLLVEWNDTAQSAPALAVHRLFALRAERMSPSAVAVRSDAGSLTWGELAALVRTRAGNLRALGAGPEQLVAVCLERSTDLVATLLAVLASGAAYLPLDPRDPEERRTQILQDARPLLLLTGRALAAGPEVVRTVCVEDLEAATEDTAPDADGPANALAYVLYTSGSTGQPKGVEVDHASLSAYLAWIGGVLEDAGVRWLPLLSSVNFDASLKQLFAPLLRGETVRVISEDALLRPARLLEILGEAPGAGCNTVPALWEGLLSALEQGEAAPPADLRALFLGGERLPEELVSRTRRLLPGVAIYNLYGPTEATANAAWALLGDSGGVVLGRPVGGAQIGLADRDLRPVPLGALGEICVGGTAVARGYRGRARLTAERFRPDPFAPSPGGRLYLTGDLARQRTDGALEFIGRLDHQVKIRGFRIELGEIEAALAALPGVRAVAVVVREDRPGDRRLVAYVADAADPADPADADTLRLALRERLPDYMVPAAFVVLPALPLTPNGKVDRKALPAPEGRGAEEASRAPLTPVEEVLAGIWSEVLGLEAIGAEEDFFALGGHSLLATRVISRLRTTCGVELPLRTLFEAPTIAGLASRVEAALRAGAGRVTPPLVPVPREDVAPLSFAQQRLWFIDQLDPGKPLYNIPVALRVEGLLDADVMALCLGEIVRRHEVLRTVFATFKGSPVQRIQPPSAFRLAVVDLSELPESVRGAVASALAGEEANRPFDLTRGPLLRGVLLRLAERDHVAALTMHHIASDGWSMGVLVREVAALYAAFAEGRPSPLPELPVQYADFALWQSGWLRGQVLEEQLAWWRGELAGAPDLLRLPTDRPRPAVQSGRGAARPVRLTAGVTRQVQALSRREGATAFMVLLAGLQVLLARHADQNDVLVGSPIANRNHTEVEDLIGCFVNTLVLRARLDEPLTFRGLLARARTTALGAYAHQDLPFEKLVEGMHVPRNLGHNPLVQVLFQVQNTPAGALKLPGLTLAPAESGEPAAKLDLSLTLGEVDGLLEGILIYAADLFDAATTQRLAEGFATLLAGAAAHPDLPLADLPILTAGERHQLLAEWNDTAVPRPTGTLLHELFAGCAAGTPHAPAVIYEDRTLTYAELDRITDRLAGRLRGLGVGPDVAVGVLMERSAELVVALLGILKAGGGYLPLDPELPQERLAWMIGEARGPVLLAQERLLPLLPPVEARILLLDAGWEGSAADAGNAVLPVVSDESLAYVLYTSGSTGRPKGVMIPHRGIVNRLLWMQEAYGLAPEDRILQKTPFSFDVSVWELFWPLITGSCLVVARPGGHRDGAYLAGLMARERVTVTHFVPSMLQVFLDQRDLSGCTGLRLVVASGEALSPELRQRFRERLPARLENLYGPTEASVDVTAWNCADVARGGIVPIGRPVANTRIHLLDRSFRPIPVGVAGELCIGGVQLARGYLDRPDLTAERFVPDVCEGAAGGRLYRTGDLARHLPDGAVEFLGRIDHQVKIRGFRIEIGEIEAALCAHPDVREAAVLPRGEGADRGLVAYVTPADASPATLRVFLRTRLPEPMIPAAWVALPALPLSPNGKLDRRALGRMEPASLARREESGPTRPLGQAEEAVAAVWREILGIEEVGRHESFFDLGGHSLLLVRVQARLAEELGREVSLVDLFRYPTVSTLAGFLEPDAAVPAPSPRSRPLSPETRRIAIVGMAGRFPGASGVEAFWENLCAGVESISFHSDAELEAAGTDPATRSSARFVPARGVLEGIELFDAGFFGYTPRDAEITDPQHRLFLECAWEALESAGYVPGGPGPVGVFAGVARSSYLWNLISNPEILQSVGPYRIAIATDKDSLSTTVSYKLDLKGPSLAIQTACSTSLVAVHVACRSLLAGECDMALAGGASIPVPQRAGYLYEEGGINSPDGHCRAFDARAQGTVGGSGVGVVVLKRLEDALADGDPVHAVILGSAINNDGAGKVGYMAPSVDGQAEAIRTALEVGGVDPRTVGYVEAHGTGTPLGDPIEIAALTQAFRAAGSGELGDCALGSVKTNIGHLDAAAGVAGLIKTALAVKHGLIPPSLHFESPNPAIDFAASPFRVNARLQEWRPDGMPRRAGVSSFGIGGTNAHVILEEAPPAEPSGPSRRYQVLLLSARTSAALDAATRNLGELLSAHPEASLPDVAWTLQVGRKAFEHRRMLVCEGMADAVAALREPTGSGRVFTRRQEPGRSAVAFLFPGQGTQAPDMGREPYEEEPVFRAQLDACAERLLPLLGRDLREVLFPAVERREEAARELRQTRFAQPALFAVELALARLWISWGIRPWAMIGHSLGEYVAACLAGVFSLEDALELVAVRGALMQELPPGAMLSVELSEGELSSELETIPGLSLAAVNAPSLCAASGPEEAVAVLEERLAGRGVRVRRLHTSHAFHSAMMDSVLTAFAERVARTARKPPAIPFVSNLTGTWITPEQATDPGYWARHLRETVRFADGIATLLAGSKTALLEVGPGSALAELARRQSGPAGWPSPISSLRSAAATEPDSAVLLRALGRLWLAGAEVDWQSFHAGERRRRVPLPTYPFERRRFWVEASRQGLAPVPGADRRRFVVVGGDPEETLARTLQAGGHEVERARSAVELDGLFTDPRSVEALEHLLSLEPGLRVVLPLAPKAEAVSEPGAPAAPVEPLAGHRRPDLSTPWQAPGSDFERRIAVIWQELLGIAEIGVHDNFFELGGHSLLATQVIARVREAFGLELPINSLYDTPTLAGLAARIEEGRPAEESTPPLAAAPRSGPLPVSFAQQRLLFLHLLAPADTAYNLPLGLRLTGPLDRAALTEALRRLEGRHEALRTTFVVDEERVSQIVSPVAAAGNLPWIDLAGLPPGSAEAESHRIAAEDAALPFDLLQGPVWRARLVRLAPEEHTLALTVHHVAADGWSNGILFRETADLYESLVEMRQPDLPELPVQYADFAAWQRSWLRGEAMERLLTYWKRQLAGLPILDLPTDRPRPPVWTGQGGARFSQIPAELVESLHRLARQEDATLFMVLSAGFSVLLRRDSGSDDIVLGTDIANRTQRETEGLIGLFVNQIVLRHDLSGDLSFRELLHRVRRLTLEAYAHQDAPFDKLVEAINPPRDPSRTPLFQVKIVLQNTPAEARTVRQLTLSALGLENRTAKFDLLLNLTESASGLTCSLEYASDLFEPTTIDRLLERFAAVLRTVSEQPEARLSEIEQILGLRDLQAQEERARGRRSEAVLRARHRRTAAAVR
jgi:amino acid adenylation domain-containing protein